MVLKYGIGTIMVLFLLDWVTFTNQMLFLFTKIGCG